MEPLSWYLRRLQRMSPSEIAWRVRSAGSDLVDRARYARGWHPKPDGGIDARITDAEPGFRFPDGLQRSWPAAADSADTATAALCARAERVLDHHLSFFDLEDQFLGDPIDWHRDHSAGRIAPRAVIHAIDYRDFPRVGDCKLVWEPNRHHQWVVLGRAYRASGDPRFARGIVAQLESWIAQNPFGHGMNWRNPLELGVRLINWVFAWELIRGSEADTAPARRTFFQNLYALCWETARKFSQGSSANNHLVGEAAGVYVAARYARGFPEHERWAREAKAILEREIGLQTFVDGCIAEHALGYSFFVFQLYLVCGLVGRWSGDPFSDAYWQRLERMLEFLALLQAGGPLPMFGDQDDGYVLDLDDHPHDVAALLAPGAVLFDRADFARRAGRWSRTGHWLLGDEGAARFAALYGRGERPPLVSRAFDASGYYLLESGDPLGDERVSLFIDCAELGYGAIAAHGHADALGFALRLRGRDLLVDPGTYDYYSYPKWRDHFRTTAAHNCVTVDRFDQSEMHGRFLWGRRAHARRLRFEGSASGGLFEGEHDGYRRLADPVSHRRLIRLDSVAGLLVIDDRLCCRGRHEIGIHFQFAEQWALESTEGNCCVLRDDHGETVRLCLDPALEITALRGSEVPPAGWISRGYHRRTPAWNIVARGRIDGERCFRTRLEFEPLRET